MTFRTYTLPTVLSMTVGALAFAVAAACGGSSFDSSGRTQPVKPGTQCTGSGTAPSTDGCNSCTCTEGSWACTDMACPADGGTGGCTPGTKRMADDNCNTCSCSADGQWQCTLLACASCTPGQTTNDGCNSCSCSGGEWVCTNRACPPPPPPPPPPVCVEGEQTMMDCNTCTCSGGAWACTKRACPPPQCTDGETMYDGCNSCTCMGGQWGCTARYCPPPPPPVDAGPPQNGCGGWLGNTCTQDEYCAYQEGQMCGAADASALCEPRPQACDTVYDPICGCDGKTYPNACTAAVAGTGVMHKGNCTTGTF